MLKKNSELDKGETMSQAIVLVGVVYIPKKKSVPKEYKALMRTNPHMTLFGKKEYKGYYVVFSGSTCSTSEERLVDYFKQMCKNLDGINCNHTILMDFE